MGGKAAAASFPFRPSALRLSTPMPHPFAASNHEVLTQKERGLYAIIFLYGAFWSSNAQIVRHEDASGALLAGESRFGEGPTEVREIAKMSQDAANRLTDKRPPHVSPVSPANAHSRSLSRSDGTCLRPDLPLIVESSMAERTTVRGAARFLISGIRPPQPGPQKKTSASKVDGRLAVLVAGARYAQRCPVEFGVPMEVVFAA